MMALPLNELLKIPLAGLTLVVDNAKSPVDPLSLKKHAIARQRSLSKIHKRADKVVSGRNRWSTNGQKPEMASTGPPPPPPPPPGVGNDVLARVERGMSPLAPKVRTRSPIKPPIHTASPQVSQRKALLCPSVLLEDGTLYGDKMPPRMLQPMSSFRPRSRQVISQKATSAA